MNAHEIAQARAVAEESEDRRLIRDLCDALEKAQEDWKDVWKRGYRAGIGDVGGPW